MRYNPRIDTVVVTHPDPDHYNYLPDVLTDAHHPVVFQNSSDALCRLTIIGIE